MDSESSQPIEQETFVLPFFDPQAFVDVTNPLMDYLHGLEARIKRLEAQMPAPVSLYSAIPQQQTGLGILDAAAGIVIDAYTTSESEQ